MASPVSYNIGLYNRTAIAQNSTSYDGLVTNAYLKHATDIRWTMPLNGIDQLDFSLYLDDPAALLIQRKQSFIRIWRNINDTEASKTRTPPAGTPDFCGVVTRTRKSGSENKMQITAMSPLWFLQSRFHVDNHRLVTDTSDYGDITDYEGGNADDLPWDQSALMFRIIDMINGAFNDSGGDTGIRRPATREFDGDTNYWPKTVNVSPFFVAKGTTPWSHIFQNLMQRPSAPDIIPQYIYTSGSRNTMYFNTDIHRGTDRYSTVSFDYRTGSKNLSDCEEEAQVVPGEYGNFVWVVGDGGPNGGVLGQASDPADMAAKGLYMVREDVRGAKVRDVNPDVSGNLTEPRLAISMSSDDEIYSVQLSPLTSTYFGIDFFLGDMIKLNANKGALIFSNKKQRIYEVELSLSDTNVETVSVKLSNDFKGKFD